MFEKSVFKHRLYFVYNIYISEKCMTQMGREYIRDLFSLLQLNLILNGKKFILQYLFNLSCNFFTFKWPNTRAFKKI
jgi:hypothetical protein